MKQNHGGNTPGHPLLGRGKGWIGQGGGKEGKDDGDCSPTSLGID